MEKERDSQTALFRFGKPLSSLLLFSRLLCRGQGLSLPCNFLEPGTSLCAWSMRRQSARLVFLPVLVACFVICAANAEHMYQVREILLVVDIIPPGAGGGSAAFCGFAGLLAPMALFLRAVGGQSAVAFLERLGRRECGVVEPQRRCVGGGRRRAAAKGIAPLLEALLRFELCLLL